MGPPEPTPAPPAGGTWQTYAIWALVTIVSAVAGALAHWQVIAPAAP